MRDPGHPGLPARIFAGIMTLIVLVAVIIAALILVGLLGLALFQVIGWLF